MGVGVILSQALQRVGIESRVLTTSPHEFEFREDFLIRPRTASLFARAMRRYLVHDYGDWKRWKPYSAFDILHSHDNAPLPHCVLKHWEGRVFQHYHDPKTRGPIYDNMPSFVSLPTLLNVVPGSTWLPLPSDTVMFRPAKHQRKTSGEALAVGYNDQNADLTKRQLIPYDEIERGIKRSTNTIPCPLRGIVSHDQMPDYYGKLDMWVDRFGVGFYGFAAVEVAAMGIPVIAEVHQAVRRFVPTCPFYIVNKDEVPDAIVRLASDKELRNELGKQSWAFANSVHNADKVAALCVQHYQRVLGERLG